MTDESAARPEVLRTRDLTGWEVEDAAGDSVGSVSELLLGRDGRVRFLAVRRGVLAATVLVPVDELRWGDASMRLRRWSAADLKRLPAYDPDLPLTAALLEEMARAHPRYYADPPEWDAPGPAEEAGILPLADARGFRLPRDAPDPRGWTVFGADNERVGTVSGLLVDPRELKVRYLDVDVADDLFGLKEDRHVAVPLEAVELRERGADAWVRGLGAAELARLPAYTGGPLDPLVEARVRHAFDGHMDGDRRGKGTAE